MACPLFLLLAGLLLLFLNTALHFLLLLLTSLLLLLLAGLLLLFLNTALHFLLLLLTSLLLLLLAGLLLLFLNTALHFLLLALTSLLLLLLAGLLLLFLSTALQFILLALTRLLLLALHGLLALLLLLPLAHLCLLLLLAISRLLSALLFLGALTHVLLRLLRGLPLLLGTFLHLFLLFRGLALGFLPLLLGCPSCRFLPAVPHLLLTASPAPRPLFPLAHLLLCPLCIFPKSLLLLAHPLLALHLLFAGLFLGAFVGFPPGFRLFAHPFLPFFDGLALRLLLLANTTLLLGDRVTALLHPLAPLIAVLPALPFKTLPAARIRNDFLRLVGICDTALLNMLADIIRQLPAPLHDHLSQIPADTSGSQSLVPIHFHTRCNHLQIPAADPVSQLATAAEVRALVHPQVMDGKFPPDLLANPVITRPTNENPMLVHLIAGDVRRVPDDQPIARNGKAIPLDAVSEIPVGNEGERSASDPEFYLDGRIPRTTAPRDRLRRERRPADMTGAFPPRHPGRSPLAAGNPDPAGIPKPRPASVVIASPTEWLARQPGPPLACKRPAPAGIWPP